MAARPGLDLELKASTEAFVAQMKAAGNSTRDVAQAMRRAFEEAGVGAGRGREPIEGFAGTLRGFAAEQRGVSRMASLMTREFGALGEVAGVSGAAIHNVALLFVEGFAGGAGFGLAIAAVNLMAQAWTHVFNESKKAKEEAVKAAAELEEALSKYAAAMARARGDEQAAVQIEHEAQLAVKRRELAKATTELAEAEEKAATWAGTFADEFGKADEARMSKLRDNARKLAIDALTINTDLYNKIEALRQREMDKEAEEAGRRAEAWKKWEEKATREAAIRAAEPLTPQEKAAWEARAAQAMQAYRDGLSRMWEAHTAGVGAKSMEQPVLQVPMFSPEQKKAYDELAKFTAKMRELEVVTGGVGGVFSALGEKFNSSALKMMGQIGDLISKAVALAVAMAATGGPFAWVNLPATLAAITAVIASIPKFEAGTPYVPQTGLALLHQGERVVSAAENAAGGRSGGAGRPIVVYAMDGPSLRRSLRQNRGELARALAELSDDGRGR